jgi:uncharacterized protein involved in exopolysaccharide biosynthesis
MNQPGWRPLVVTYWRVPVIAVLAGILAFGGSFLLTPAYEASTRLLIRGRDATFLTSTSQGLGSQPGVGDATLAKALGETQSALLSTRTVAEMVVDDLSLAHPRPKPAGLVGRARSLFAGAYKRVRAILTHGFYAEPDQREKAIEGVYSGLAATPVKDSYVIELRATADTPKLAKAIADSAANALVEVSRRRFAQDSGAYRDFLGAQVTRAAADESAAAAAVRKYKQDNGISDVDLEIRLSETAAQQLGEQRKKEKIDLDGTQAEITALEQTLATTPTTDSSTTKIQTGRSTTELQASGASSRYEQLLAQKQQLGATAAGMVARLAAIDKALAPGVSPSLTGQESELARLELQHSVASDTFKQLSARHQEAVVAADIGTVEVTRLDQATAPTYPVAPVRYLYLALGAMFGAAGALGLQMLRRRPADGPDVEVDGDEPVEVRLPTEAEVP